MLVFIHNLGSFAGRHKRHHTKEGICPGPWSSPWYHQPWVWEDGREIEVFVLFTELGRILHIHIPSPINSMFPAALKLNNKELTSLSGTSLITWAICTPTTGGSSHVTTVKVTGRTPSLLQDLFPELSYQPVLKGILLTHWYFCKHRPYEAACCNYTSEFGEVWPAISYQLLLLHSLKNK